MTPLSSGKAKEEERFWSEEGLGRRLFDPRDCCEDSGMEDDSK
jgi:hypothetical protein